MSKNIAVIGATGVVGQEIIGCLHKLKFPVRNLYLASSERSLGKSISTPFGRVVLEAATEKILAKSDIAIFSAGSEISRGLVPLAKKYNCLVIDNSSAFRYDDEVPLVVPEINSATAKNHQGIIANPNCTTIIAAVALWPLHQAFKLKKVIVSTYQAVSGAGKEAMEELVAQTKQYLNGQEETIEHFQHPIAFNIIPNIDALEPNGYTKEEMKVVWEMRKIFNDSALAISCTAVRIPVLRAHSETIVVETANPVNPDLARRVLEKAPGIKVVDEPSKNVYPMPRMASNHDEVLVGRIRNSLIFGDHGLEFFVSGDQLLKGAALNAVQIAKLFI